MAPRLPERTKDAPLQRSFDFQPASPGPYEAYRQLTLRAGPPPVWLRSDWLVRLGEGENGQQIEDGDHTSTVCQVERPRSRLMSILSLAYRPLTEELPLPKIPSDRCCAAGGFPEIYNPDDR